eukprot:TRINITY_DN1675_c1_g1_i1.p1 TRINITY_DN1675_c1_g1~~TRINITY_DN1675_c1_g1_i1.p1  ORF type:complete len:676 (+),score=161.93 TRINITY_DN1675_c1_g1_i1:117-2144(+)
MTANELPAAANSEAGDQDKVQQALDANGAVDVQDDVDLSSLLHAAARAGDREKVLQALDAKVAVNVRDDWGLSPLHNAAIAGHAEVLSLLLDRNAGLDASSQRGQTALHMAASEGKDAAVDLLIRRRADVALPSAHGILPLELASRSGSAVCEDLIRQEATRRLKNADRDLQDLQERVCRAEKARGLLESQLLGEPEERESRTDGGSVAPEGKASPVGSAAAEAIEGAARAKQKVTDLGAGYWQRTEAFLTQVRLRGQAVLLSSFTRAMPDWSPDGSTDSFPWSGELCLYSPLPQPDPEDTELWEAQERLTMVAREKQRRREASNRSTQRAAEEDAALEDEILGMVMDQALDEGMGHSQAAWDELVEKLTAPDGCWDWTKVEVRALKPNQFRNRPEVNTAVYAVDDTGGDEEDKIVFQAGDVIGPLGGVLRRKSRYMMEHYGSHSWFFHDPWSQELQERIQIAELKTEPLLLDFSSASNRLMYIRDIREDPFGLCELLPPPARYDAAYANSEVSFHSSIDEPPASPSAGTVLFQPRKPMPRVRSRPGSPARTNTKEGSVARISEEDAASSAHETDTYEANTQIVEVRVHGWPYAFVVARRDIQADEELTIDRGEEFWAGQCAALARYKSLLAVAEELQMGVQKPEQQQQQQTEEKPQASFGPRQPRKRATSKEKR